MLADGHEVTVFERRGTVAAGSSFANAGSSRPATSRRGRRPGCRRRCCATFSPKHAPVRIAGMLARVDARLALALVACVRPQHLYRANRARMHRLAHFSRERLLRLHGELQLDFERGSGFLVLLRSARELALAQPGVRALAELGAAPAVLDAAGCRAIEPGLNPETPLHAGIYSKDDEVGNCRQFATPARKEAAARRRALPLQRRVETIRAGARAGLRVLQRAARCARGRSRASRRRAAVATPARREARRATEASTRSSFAPRSNRVPC